MTACTFLLNRGDLVTNDRRMDRALSGKTDVHFLPSVTFTTRYISTNTFNRQLSHFSIIVYLQYKWTLHPHEVLFQSETRARVGGRLGNRTSPGFETGTLCSTVTMKTRLFRGTVTVFAAIMVVSQYAVMSRKKYHLLVGESSADSPQCSVSAQYLAYLGQSQFNLSSQLNTMCCALSCDLLSSAVLQPLGILNRLTLIVMQVRLTWSPPHKI